MKENVARSPIYTSEREAKLLRQYLKTTKRLQWKAVWCPVICVYCSKSLECYQEACF